VLAPLASIRVMARLTRFFDLIQTRQICCVDLLESVMEPHVERGNLVAAARRTTAKAEYLARPRLGPSACPFGQAHTTRRGEPVTCGLMHAHVAAMRYAVKHCSGTSGFRGVRSVVTRPIGRQPVFRICAMGSVAIPQLPLPFIRLISKRGL
jgi:hypothetical protein